MSKYTDAVLTRLNQSEQDDADLDDGGVEREVYGGLDPYARRAPSTKEMVQGFRRLRQQRSGWRNRRSGWYW